MSQRYSPDLMVAYESGRVVVRAVMKPDNDGEYIKVKKAVIEMVLPVPKQKVLDQAERILA